MPYSNEKSHTPDCIETNGVWYCALWCIFSPHYWTWKRGVIDEEPK